MNKALYTHFAIRAIALIFGLAMLFSCYNAFEAEHHLITQAWVASIGGSLMAFCVTFWPGHPGVLAHRALFSSAATFLFGVTWIMAKSDGYISFPGLLMVAATTLGAFALFAPSRHLR